MRTPRRQNVSCDTCRRSKRRCTSKDGTEPDPTTACSRCLRVGQPCTWNFVHAHATAKKVTLDLSRSIRAASVRQDDPHTVKLSDASSIAEFDPLWSSSVTPGTDEETAARAKRGSPRDPPSANASAALRTPESIKDGLEHQWARSRQGRSTRSPPCHALGPWQSNTMESLNRRLTSTIFNQKHTAIYHIVQKWCTERYLSQTSNPFSPRGGYVIEPEGPRSDHQPDHIPECAGNAIQDTKKLSLLSAARLLDSFAELYGNPLTAQDLDHATRAQQAVFQAWSMQWLPCSTTQEQTSLDSRGVKPKDADDLIQSARSKDLYAAYWWQAQRLLWDTRSSASFTRILTVLMFSIVATPNQALSTVAIGDRPLDLLNRAILQMQALLRMLHEFCNRLSPLSQYKALLECAGSIMHWFGYLRDTSASLALGSPLMLRDVHISHDDRTEDSDLEAGRDRSNGAPMSAETAGHRIAKNTIALWRFAIRLESSLSDSDIDLEECMTALRSCCHLIELCDGNEVLAVESELSDCNDMGLGRQSSAAHHLLSWDYGVLKTVQYCRRMQSLPISCASSALLQQMIGKLDTALIRSMSLVAATTSCDNPEHKGAVKIALIAQNSNLPLVTQIFTDFVDHAAGLCRTPSFQNSHDGVMDAGIDQRYLVNLLLSLSLLHRSMHGSSIAREALQDLMGRHSDVLMHAWLSIEQPHTTAETC